MKEIHRKGLSASLFAFAVPYLLSNVFEQVPKSHNIISIPWVNDWNFKLLYPYKRNNKSWIKNRTANFFS